MSIVYNKPGYKYRWIKAEMPTQIPKAVRLAGDAAIIDWLKAKAAAEFLNSSDLSFWKRPAFSSWLHELLIANHPIALAALAAGWHPSLAYLQENCHFEMAVVNGRACLQFKAFPNPLLANPRLHNPLDENIAALGNIAAETTAAAWKVKSALIEAIQAQLNQLNPADACNKFLPLWHNLSEIYRGKTSFDTKFLQGFRLKKDLYAPGLIRKQGNFVIGVFNQPVDINLRQKFLILSFIDSGHLVDQNEVETKPSALFSKKSTD